MTAVTGRAAALLVGSVAAALLGTVAFVLAARLVGEAVYAADAPPAVALCGYLALGCLAWTASVTAGGLAGVELSARLRRRGLDHALAADPDQVETFGAGGAFALALDAELVGSFLVTTAPAAVLGVTQTLAGAVLSARCDQGAVRAGVVVAAVVAMGVAGLRLDRARAAWTGHRVGLSARLVERLIGQRTVALQEAPGPAAAHTRAGLAGYEAAGRRMDRAAVAVNAATHGASVTLVLLSVAAWQRGLPAPDVAAALGAAFLVEAGLVNARTVVEEVVAARVAAAGLGTLAGMEADVVPAPPAGPAGVVVAARGADLGYPGATVLSGVDLEVRTGERVLLTGSSGSGKTTLVETLSGRRAVLGGDLVAAPGAVVARVPQTGDDHVLHASLLFNVVAGRCWPPDRAAEDDVLQVLDDLGLAGLVARMPAGVLQPVGDGGWRLSAGEAARVRLARALVRRPDLLILDETFAALDAATFDRALAAARKWAGSLIVVAHP